MDLYLMCNNCGGEINISTSPPGTDHTCPLCGSVNQAFPQRLETGSILAGYQILQRIETHGAAETYLAEPIRNHGLVRLQTFKSPSFESGLAAEYYLTAMRQWMQVRQANIVKVLEAGRGSNGMFFAASAPAKGMTLEDRLWRGGAVELKPAIFLATSISRILEWLWNEHGLIYGQLTPRNISLTPDRNIFLANMALAPILKTRPPGIPFKEFVTSTPGFTSPEQLSTPDILDCRGDMYALGATLYHMLTGKPPFACLNAGEVLTKQRAPSLADPRLFRPDLPDEFVWLLEILLAHDPKDRFDSWAALIEILASLDFRKTPLPARTLKSHSVLVRLPPSDIAKLSRHATPKPVQALYPGPTPPAGRDYFGIILGSTIVLFAVLVILFATLVPRQQNKTYKVPPPVAAQGKVPHLEMASKSQNPAPKSAPFVTQLIETRKFARDNPGQYEEILDRYEKLLAMAETNAPRWVPDLQRQVRAIDLSMAAPLDDAEMAIRKRVREFEEYGRYQDGMDWLRSYPGPFKNKTKRLRQSLSNMLGENLARQNPQQGTPPVTGTFP